jgi:hypothetical protein
MYTVYHSAGLHYNCHFVWQLLLTCLSILTLSFLIWAQFTNHEFALFSICIFVFVFDICMYTIYRKYYTSHCVFFRHQAIAYASATFGSGTGLILYALQCRGYEDTIAVCPFDSWGQSCGHNRDAGVNCLGGKHTR